MKMVLLHGQNHKGSTYHIGRMLAEQLGTESEITEFFLPRDMPHFCCGCAVCFAQSEQKCPHFSAMQPITDAIDQADVLIFTSPVYVYHVSGSMKALLDHYGYRWMVHRPEASMFRKQAVCITTAAGAGMRSACKDLLHSFFFWGVGKRYSYGVAVAAVNWDGVKPKKKAAIAKRVQKLQQKIQQHSGNGKPSLKTKLFFSMMRIVQQHGWNPADVTYWKEQGWLGKKRPWKE